jgi:hypothetical protein
MALSKVKSINTKFKWLNIYEDNPKYKTIGIFLPKHKYSESIFIETILELFKYDMDNILLGPTGIKGRWDAFWGYNIDLKDIHDEFNLFINLINENKINFGYKGFARVTDWNKVLKSILSVILNIGGSESLFFYNSKAQYVFYPHYSWSVGIYYVQINEELQVIMEKAELLGCKLKFI